MSAREPHILSYKQLLGVLCALFALTALTVGASRIHVGALNIWLALLIAAVKASIVLMFFMHLKYEARAFVATFLATLFTVAVFIGFMFWDIAYRSPVH
jgi:cytochrome c oxidase subunit IV